MREALLAIILILIQAFSLGIILRIFHIELTIPILIAIVITLDIFVGLTIKEEK